MEQVAYEVNNVTDKLKPLLHTADFALHLRIKLLTLPQLRYIKFSNIHLSSFNFSEACSIRCVLTLSSTISLK